MTLDEAIEHAKEVARTCDDSQCAAEHIQLTEWLRRARGADKAARWYMSKIQELEAENAELSELVRDTWEIASYSQCTPCKFFDTCDGCPCILRERIHELGIEV